ncbi:hypothetical protein CD32_10155 [Lysinibacillus odysseyi 34hs-1 = NBRC 100172]|uniref:G5 domain-containing protein n=1 Tax=Lysinibacillus odysseyi 34hs-1 = NBRC 100172 TaxID=1220589 RepID=A0A0A3IMZ7_9BACI|nr:hypothetical protein CD32_10155 [Lysinibacillus odysseyi 34hs-1 = NBRC 100172]
MVGVLRVKKNIIMLALLASLLIYIVSPLNSFEFKTAYAEENGSVSTIAGIEVGNLTEGEMRTVLTDAVNQWMNEPLVVTDGGNELSLNTSVIRYDIDSTIALYKNMVKKDWYAFWKDDKVIHIPLEALPNEEIKNEISKMSMWNEEETYAQVMSFAGYLKSGEVEAAVEDTSALETERIALAIEKIPETAFGTYDIAQVLNDQVIAPGETFSFVQSLGENADIANSEALQFVASLIYQNALNINTEIVERQSQHKIPNYLEPGIEAAITSSGDKNLQFTNRLATPIKLKLSVEEQQLKAEMYTTQKEAAVTTRVVRDEEIKPRTITRYSNELAAGQVKEVQKGEQGLRVSVYRVIDGVEELVSRDYYPPVNRVLLKSSRQLQTQQSADTDPDLQMDLNGDGLADVESSDEAGAGTKDETNNETINEAELEVDENGNAILPPGSYYDKGGNLITP